MPVEYTSRSPIVRFGVASLVMAVAIIGDWNGLPTMAQDISSNVVRKIPHADELTNQIDALSFEEVLAQERMDPQAFYLRTRIISPISPIVVRQDDPAKPKYQEALGYTFLINNVKFPGLVRMDNGRLVLTLTGVLDPPDKRVGLILFSDDEGQSWTQPRRLPTQRITPVNLGGNRLMLCSRELWFSDDGGLTWKTPKTVPPLPDGRACHTDVSYHPLVEGDTITFLFWSPIHPGYDNWERGDLFTEASLRRYHLYSNTWDEPVMVPREWALNEGSVIRANNGNLVGAFRTQMVGVPIENDHWMGLATSVSSDNGKTWSKPAHHFLYGRVHCSLLNLPDGRILMTYAVRIGQLDGHVYHGIEAVVSRDQGDTWDWPHRYIIARWPNTTMHSPRSTLLEDGRILTVYMNDTFFSWTEDGLHPLRSNNVATVYTGNVSVVIWRP